MSGAIAKNAGRFKDRTIQKGSRPLGEPYATMTPEQKAAWAEIQHDMPWLTSSDRIMVRLACSWVARMDKDDLGVAASSALATIMSKLGATPVDVSKVRHASDEEEDPTDEFFGRPH
ncbi:hypothetical protein [Pseudorhodoferax soli]|uniref:hypothetical protein n=1 Tax=Pseudorhodoferax soli TaxID=545864 RepID=UPI001FECA5DD|nr:hypothetical protein [Pseudorhodoferax soli]